MNPVEKKTRNPSIKRYDPSLKVPLLELPEGTKKLSWGARLIRRGEQPYDLLWRYVRVVDKKTHRGQGARVHFGEHSLGLRNAHRIPSRIDFKQQILYHGHKLCIPFGSLRSVMVVHGLLPDRKIPVFTLAVRADGCDQYIPIHRCQIDESITELAEFVSSRLRIPLGCASRPLGLLVEPSSSEVLCIGGALPLYEFRSLLTTRDPVGITHIKLLLSTQRILLVEDPDPLGWYERWGIIMGDILSVVLKRMQPKYGNK